MASTRLVVELPPDVEQGLADEILKDRTNRTCVTARALRLYHRLREIDRRGGEVLVREKDQSAAARVLFL